MARFSHPVSDSTRSPPRSPTVSSRICSSSSANSSRHRQAGREPRADPAPGAEPWRGMRLLQRDVERGTAREARAPGGGAGWLTRRALLLGKGSAEGRIRRGATPAQPLGRAGAGAAGGGARQERRMRPRHLTARDGLTRGPVGGAARARRARTGRVRPGGERARRGRPPPGGGDEIARRRAAEARYAQVVVLLPDSLEGQQAQVRVLRALAAQTDSMPDLVAVRGRLGRLGQGAAAGEARALEALLRRVLDAEAGEGSQFRTAELTRDSLGAPRLAARLFVAFTAAHPGSLFAPKALVAAVALLPDARDSLVAVLDARYPTSPYTLALHGAASPAFAAAEDSLAHALGVERAALPELLLFARVAPPVPGPRGPMLDPPPVGTLAAAPPAPPAVDGARGAPRPSGKRDDGPVHRPRPADQPTPRDSL